MGLIASLLQRCDALIGFLSDQILLCSASRCPESFAQLGNVLHISDTIRDNFLRDWALIEDIVRAAVLGLEHRLAFRLGLLPTSQAPTTRS